MGRALFVGFSVIFLTVYVLLANEAGVFAEGGEPIRPISVPAAPETGGGFFGAVEGIVAVFRYGFDMFSQFLQLLAFQIPGQEATSIITVIVFVPLAFINGYIIFTAIRGS